MKTRKLNSDECSLATTIIMCLIIQGKRREAKRLSKTFQTPTGVNLVYDYNKAIKSINKKKLKFSKEDKQKEFEHEKELKKN